MALLEVSQNLVLEPGFVESSTLSSILRNWSRSNSSIDGDDNSNKKNDNTTPVLVLY